MRIMTVQMILFLVLLLAVCVGGVFLQIFLSKKEGALPGLILPLLSFLGSLVFLLNLSPQRDAAAWQVFAQAAVTFLVSNIPTLVLLAICFACKEKSRRQRQLEKMNIQDLD